MNGVIQILGRMATLGAHESTPAGPRRGITFSVTRALWRMTLGPVYRLLFRAHFDAIEGRLEEVTAQLRAYDASLRNQSAAMSDYGTELRTHIHGLNVRLDDLAGRVAALDEQVRTVLAGQYEQEAIAHRLAALEDRMPTDRQNGL
jgi:hypothetical protein